MRRASGSAAGRGGAALLVLLLAAQVAWAEGDEEPAWIPSIDLGFEYFAYDAAATLDNLLSAGEELGIPESSIELVEVPDPAQAEERRFQGSPTVLVDGRDIATGEIPSGFNYACRVYSFEGKSTGVIPRDFIRARLIEWGEVPNH